MAALEGAVAFAEADHVAELIGEDLHLDVLGILDEFLDIHVAVAERAFRLGHGSVESLDQAGVVVRHAHAASAAACGRLDDDRVSEFVRLFERRIFGGNDIVAAGRYGHSCLAHRLARGCLVAHGAHLFGGRADELDLAVLADLRELRIFGKESVAGVDRIDVADLGHADDAFDHEVTLRGGRGSDADGLIGQTDGQAVLVGLGINDYGFDAHFTAGADDPHGDFAAIGNQDFIEHAKPVSVGDYSSTKSG